MSNYYKDTWTKENGHGSIFWKNANFDTGAYRLQEHIFRQTLISLKNIMGYGIHKGKVESVLELGAGTGRMTEIMLELFDESIKQYDVVDLHFEESWTVHSSKVDAYEMDITTDKFLEGFRGKRYDFILASEVFLHIRPEDIGKIMQMVCRLAKSKGSGTVLNIDWAFEPNYIPKKPTEWCWIHDYDKLYRENGLHPIFTADMKEIRQKLFCYGGAQ